MNDEKTRKLVTDQIKNQTLKEAKWTYHGCGYWIDPITKKKIITDKAFEIQGERMSQKTSEKT